MSDDTRDIAIETRTEVKNLSTTVATLVARVEALQAALNERKGAEKLARWIVGGASGSLSAGATMLVAKFVGLPWPK